MKTSCKEFMNRSELLRKSFVIGSGGGGGYSRFQVTGMIVWGKNQNPKKSLDQNLTPKQSHAEFSSHKNFQRNYMAQIFRLF